MSPPTLKVTLADLVCYRSAAQHAEAADRCDGAAFAGEAAWSLVHCTPIFVGVGTATPAKEPAR